MRFADPIVTSSSNSPLCGLMFYKSNIQVVGIDDEELGLYLALNLTHSELERKLLVPYCPTRKNRRGHPPTIPGYVTSKLVNERWTATRETQPVVCSLRRSS